MRRISASAVTTVLFAAMTFACASARVASNELLAPTAQLTELEAAVKDLQCGADDGSVREKTLLKPQENNYWCWAASGQMVEVFFERTPKQCEIANAFCARKPVPCTEPGCCQLPADCCVTPEACLVPGWPPFENRKIGFTRVPGPLLAREIVDEIACKKRPFLFAWEYLNDGGHIMVAVGFETINGEDFLLVNDPLPVNQGDQDRLFLPKFKTGPYRHWDDFYLLEKKP